MCLLRSFLLFIISFHDPFRGLIQLITLLINNLRMTTVSEERAEQTFNDMNISLL